MKVTRKPSLAEQLAPRADEGSTSLALDNGSRVAVVGGGPAGSFFSYFLLKMAATVGIDLEVDIYEPRHFVHCGPAGCNHCGGIVSESLVQLLAADGINIPPSVVQRGIDSYMLHMDVGSVRIDTPRREQRIAAVYRGNGPRGAVDMPWESFDAYLQKLAQERGARLIHKLVSGLQWQDGLPELLHPEGSSRPYDLVALATGINSNFQELLQEENGVNRVPQTARTFICEFQSDRDTIERVLGTSMHVFLLDLPRLEFAAIIPKGDYITMVMLGDDIDSELVDSFLNSPEVRECLPQTSTPRVCNCSPLINMKGSPRPYRDRLVAIGDCGVTRLYKDGIGAAYRTAKAAASTAIFQGISAEDFQRHYFQTCKAIETDNWIGKIIFSVNQIFQSFRFTRRAVFRMTSLEQQKEGGSRHMSTVLWNLFTGSAPYREVFLNTLHPAFVGGFLWNLAVGGWPRAGSSDKGRVK